jgi:YHS domain-containing protein
MAATRHARSWRAAIALALLILIPAAGAHAGQAVNTRSGDVAILGYDTVAYFTQNRAMKGSPEFSYEWLGATWHFASAEHRDLFAAEPIRYAPQYGGFCIVSVSMGDAANVDPQAWRIVDGRLYLSYSEDNLVEQFDAAPADLITRADANWPQVKAELEGN